MFHFISQFLILSILLPQSTIQYNTTSATPISIFYPNTINLFSTSIHYTLLNDNTMLSPLHLFASAKLQFQYQYQSLLFPLLFTQRLDVNNINNNNNNNIIQLNNQLLSNDLQTYQLLAIILVVTWCLYRIIVQTTTLRKVTQKIENIETIENRKTIDNVSSLGIPGISKSTRNTKKSKRKRRTARETTRRKMTTSVWVVMSLLCCFNLPLSTSATSLTASEDGTGNLNSVKFTSFELPFDPTNPTCLTKLSIDTQTSSKTYDMWTSNGVIGPDSTAMVIRSFVEEMNTRGLLIRNNGNNNNDINENNVHVVKVGFAPSSLLPSKDALRQLEQKRLLAYTRGVDVIHPVVVKSWYDSSSSIATGGKWSVHSTGVSPVDGRHSELIGCDQGTLKIEK